MHVLPYLHAAKKMLRKHNKDLCPITSPPARWTTTACALQLSPVCCSWPRRLAPVPSGVHGRHAEAHDHHIHILTPPPWSPHPSLAVVADAMVTATSPWPVLSVRLGLRRRRSGPCKQDREAGRSGPARSAGGRSNGWLGQGPDRPGPCPA